jgi:FkbM family methyltransferase
MNKSFRERNILDIGRKLWRQLGLIPHLLISSGEPQTNGPSRTEYIYSASPIQEELRKIFKTDEALTIFDVGSCEGEDAIRYAHMFPNALVYAFEPLPQNLLRMEKQVALFNLADRIFVQPVAISDAVGESQFYVSSGTPPELANSTEWDYGNKSSSLLEPDEVLTYYPWLLFNQTIVVKTNTIKRFCSAHNIRTIDLMHIDVQGAELNVLTGAKDIIKCTKLVWVEVEKVKLYRDQALAYEIEEFMRINHFIKVKDEVSQITGDQLYVNSDLLDAATMTLLPNEIIGPSIK